LTFAETHPHQSLAQISFLSNPLEMADVLDLGHGDDMVIDEEDLGKDELDQLKDGVKTRKGRGFAPGNSSTRNVDMTFESINSSGDKEPPDTLAQKSVEGWILMVTGVHEEAHEDDVHGRFSEYGIIRNIHLNLDRRTGFLKGYALIEYEDFKEAQAAKVGLDGTELLGNTISVDWAFMKDKRKSGRSRKYK